MKKLLLILTLPLMVNASWFGPSTYEDCVLEGLKTAKTDRAVNLMRHTCRKKFPVKLFNLSRENLLNLDAYAKLDTEMDYFGLYSGPSKKTEPGTLAFSLTNKDQSFFIKEITISVWLDETTIDKTTIQFDERSAFHEYNFKFKPSFTINSGEEINWSINGAKGYK